MNNNCPGCGKQVLSDEASVAEEKIEYKQGVVRTWWHRACAKKAGKEV
jgi:hypothetical protein